MSLRLDTLFRTLRFSRKPSTRRRTRRPSLRPHALRLEALEQRQLLNAMPIGGVTRVHPNPESTAFTQLTFSQSPKAVAMEDDGGHVVAYTSFGEDASQGGVFVRRFGGTGIVIGNPIRANTTTLGNQSHAGVASDADGDFVVVWDGPGGQSTSATTDDDSAGIYLRRYNGSGAPKDLNEIRANTTVAGAQVNPTVAMDADGDFVVVWNGNGNQPGQVDNTGVFFQRFDRFGAPQGLETRVNTETVDFQELASVGMDPNGNFVVVWGARNHPLDGSGFGVFARLYDANGAPRSGEIMVNSDLGDPFAPFRHITGNQFAPDVDMADDGSFVVTYTDEVFNVPKDIWARRFDPNGVPRGPEFKVNTSESIADEWSRVAVGPFGDFIITWSQNLGSGPVDVYAQRFQIDGSRAGTEFLVSTVANSSIGRQAFSGVASDIDGDFVVVWTGEAQFPNEGAVVQSIYKHLYSASAGAPTISVSSVNVGYPTPGGGRIVLAPAATVTDPDAVNFNTGRLTVAFTQNADVNDLLDVRNEGVGPGQVGNAGGIVTFGGVAIGTITVGNVNNPLVVTFNAAATLSAVQAVMRNVEYEHSAPMMGLPARTVQYLLTDDCGSLSNAATQNIFFGVAPPPPGGGGGGRVGSGPCPSCALRRIDFIASTYVAVLQRPASTADLAFWDGLMDRGLSKDAFARALLSSAEYRVAFIQNSYIRFLGRPAVQTDLVFWLARMNAGLSQPQLMVAIANSPEYVNRGGTFNGLVDNLYMNILGRAAAPAERAFYVSQLNAGATAGGIALAMLSSPEFRQPLVGGWYTNFLTLVPDSRRIEGRISDINLRGRWDDAQIAILTGFDAVQVPLFPF